MPQQKRSIRALGRLLFAGLPLLLVQSHALHAGWKKSCEDWATFASGDIELNNNTWGRQNEWHYQQCIYQNREQPQRMGWEWKWPQHKEGVKAYPSLMYGHKPWNRQSTTTALPRRLDQLQNIQVNFSTQMQYSGSVNLLLEAWLTDSAKPQPADRTSEIAIHLMQHQWPGQGGDYHDSVVIDGHAFDVYINHHMTVPGDPHTWSYLSFVNTGKPLLRGRINLKAFLDYLLAQGMIVPSEYLTSVELGNEIEYGEGESRVDYFRVHTQDKPQSLL
ncbi:MAG: hypothetical protein R3E89_10830 [Thiolinea sp.]